MPVYNAEKYIELSINSILNQTYSNFEFIIIDDGSEDDTISIIKNKNDERIKLFERSKQGIVNQLNFGINSSRYEIIARMDADDIAHRRRLEKQIIFLKANKNVHAVGTQYFRIDKNGSVLFKKKNPITSHACKFMAPINAPILHPTLVTYRSILFDVGLYKKEYEAIEDYELFNRMIENGNNLTNIDEFLFSYRLINSEHKATLEKYQQMKIYAYGKDYINNKVSLNQNDKGDQIKYFKQLFILEYYLGKIKNSWKVVGDILRKDVVQIYWLFRYIPILILGDTLVGYLRKKGILYHISILLNRKLKLDLYQIKK